MSIPSLVLMIIAAVLGIGSLWADSMTLAYVAFAFVGVASVYEFVYLNRRAKREQPEHTTNDNE